MKQRVSVEICVDSVASAIAAERGGADRIELCSNLPEGGTTPSAGTIEVVRSQISIAMHVMIRPRGGDFCFTAHEFEIMQREIGVAKRLGAKGIALGILKDMRTRELVELAKPLSVTFHRAFDLSPDLPRALQDVILTGSHRILTSGGKPTAMAARREIAKLVELANGRIIVMACGGIVGEDAALIIQETGVREIHAGLRRPILGTEQPGLTSISLGMSSPCEIPRFHVIEEDVRKLVRAVNAA